MTQHSGRRQDAERRMIRLLATAVLRRPVLRPTVLGPAVVGAALLGSLLLTSVAPVIPPAAAAPPSATPPQQAALPDVLSALSITQEPADYVVIVDTSSSMIDQGRYQLVRSGLVDMVGSLAPDDRLAVITFDSAPQVRRGLTPIGADPQTIVSSLPATPSGTATDIGAALGSAVDLMERGDLRQQGAVLLFTDGRIDTSPGSAYATADTPGWAALKQRASALQQRHDIAPLAIALTSNTDATVLRQVFSNVTEVPSARLGTYLPQVSTDVMKAAASGRLQGHLADPVRAVLEQPLRVTSDAAPHGVTITLHNTDPVIPLQITGLALAADPASAVTVTGAAESVDIPAGATVSTEVQVTTSAAPGTSVPLQLSGTVTSPWQAVITGDLGMSWAPTLAADPASLTVVPGAGTRWAALTHSRVTQLAGVALLLVLLAAGAWAGWWATRPRLTGVLTVRQAGDILDQHRLGGRRMALALLDGAASVTLLPERRKDGQRGVSLTATAGTDRASGTLYDGEAIDLRDLTLTYATDRSRMLQLIGTD